LIYCTEGERGYTDVNMEATGLHGVTSLKTLNRHNLCEKIRSSPRFCCDGNCIFGNQRREEERRGEEKKRGGNKNVPSLGLESHSARRLTILAEFFVYFFGPCM
jgi:hypothetical protein